MPAKHFEINEYQNTAQKYIKYTQNHISIKVYQIMRLSTYEFSGNWEVWVGE
jgi:hypothetical protein